MGLENFGGGGGGGTVTTDATLTGDGSSGTPLGINLSNSNSWLASEYFTDIYASDSINLEGGSYPSGFFNANISGLATIGDAFASINNTYIEANDTTSNIVLNTVGPSSTGVINVSTGDFNIVPSGTYPSGFFDVQNGVAFLGDGDSNNNGNYIKVDDYDQSISLNAANGVINLNGAVSLIYVQGSFYDGTGVHGTSGQVLESTGTATSWVTAPWITNILTTYGDLIVGGASGTPTVLSGNTSGANKFLTSIARGGGGSTLAYAAIQTTDLPSGTVTSRKVGANALTGTSNPIGGGATFPSGDYVVTPYININSITAGTLTLTLSYTDENTNPQTVTLYPIGLTTAALTTTGPHLFPSVYLKLYNGTSSVNVIATFAGTSINYDASVAYQHI